jgi:hypothetical protein
MDIMVKGKGSLTYERDTASQAHAGLVHQISFWSDEFETLQEQQEKGTPCRLQEQQAKSTEWDRQVILCKEELTRCQIALAQAIAEKHTAKEHIAADEVEFRHYKERTEVELREMKSLVQKQVQMIDTCSALQGQLIDTCSGLQGHLLAAKKTASKAVQRWMKHLLATAFTEWCSMACERTKIKRDAALAHELQGQQEKQGTEALVQEKEAVACELVALQEALEQARGREVVLAAARADLERVEGEMAGLEGRLAAAS